MKELIWFRHDAEFAATGLYNPDTDEITDFVLYIFDSGIIC